MIRFRCNKCSKQLNAPDELAGRRAKCNKCKSINRIPSPDLAPSPAKPEYSEAPAEDSRFKETFSEFRKEAVKAAGLHSAKVTEKARSLFAAKDLEIERETEAPSQEHTAPTGFRDFLTTFYLLPISKKILLAICTILLMSFAGLFPSFSQSNTKTGNDWGFPSIGIFAKRDGSIKLTISEFRREIFAKVTPKSEFYAKYGKPQKVTTIGDTTYLFYSCTDGLCRVGCNPAMFQGLAGSERVYAFSIDET